MSDDARTDDELNAAFRRGAKAQQDICDSEHGDAAEVDRLRAELDRHRVAGDELADALGRMKPGRDQPTAAAMAALDGWWSVRGDAPAAGRSLCACRHRSDQHDACRGCVVDGCSCPQGPFDAAPAAAPTDGQAPADEPERELAVLRKSNTTFERIVDRAFNAIPEDVEAEDDDLATYIRAVIARGEAETTALHGELSDVLGEVRALLDGSNEQRGAAHTALRKRIGGPGAAAPADDTAAPDGLTTGVRIKQEDGGTWGWECTRCDYRTVAWWSDRDVAERAAAEHERDRCPAAGQPVRDSQPEATAAPAGRKLTADDVASAIREWNVTSTELPRDAFLAERLNAAARPVRDGGESK